MSRALSAKSDRTLVGDFTDFDYDAKFMYVTLVLVAMTSAFVACAICVFLKRRQQVPAELLSSQFNNPDYERSDVFFDSTHRNSLSSSYLSKSSAPPSTPCRPPGHSKVPGLQRLCDAKYCEAGSSDYSSTSEYTSREIESFYSECPQKNLAEAKTLHKVDPDNRDRLPMLEQTPYTSTKYHRVNSAKLNVQLDIPTTNYFEEMGNSDKVAQYVNQTSLQTNNNYLRETQSIDLYSKLHAQNRKFNNTYTTAVKMCREKNDLKFCLDKGLAFPDGENVQIYEDANTFSSVYGNFDVCASIDGRGQGVNTKETGLISKCIGRADSRFTGNILAEVETIDDDDDDDEESSVSEDLYVNSDLWIVSADKTMAAEWSSTDVIGDYGSNLGVDDVVIEMGDRDTSSVFDEMYINFDSWKDRASEKQPSDDSYDFKVSSVEEEKSEAGNGISETGNGISETGNVNNEAGNGIDEAGCEIEEANNSSMDDDIYMNSDSWNVSAHKNKMTIHDNDLRDNRDTRDNQFSKHVMDSDSMSDTSSSSEEIYFNSHISTVTAWKNGKFETAQGIDCSHDNTAARLSEIEGDDNSSESDNIYVNSDMFSLGDNERCKETMGGEI